MPVKEIEVLGLLTNSETMTLAQTKEKVLDIQNRMFTAHSFPGDNDGINQIFGKASFHNSICSSR